VPADAVVVVTGDEAVDVVLEVDGLVVPGAPVPVPVTVVVVSVPAVVVGVDTLGATVVSPRPRTENR
jgi:hypothetical protein